MSDTKKNALAELAKRLEFDIRMIEFGNVAQLKRFRKAKRIVEELAKVRTNKVGWPEKLSIPLLDDMANLYAKCRAIAEEGDGDGFKRD